MDEPRSIKPNVLALPPKNSCSPCRKKGVLGKKDLQRDRAK